MLLQRRQSVDRCVRVSSAVPTCAEPFRNLRLRCVHRVACVVAIYSRWPVYRPLPPSPLPHGQRMTTTVLSLSLPLSLSLSPTLSALPHCSLVALFYSTSSQPLPTDLYGASSITPTIEIWRIWRRKRFRLARAVEAWRRQQFMIGWCQYYDCSRLQSHTVHTTSLLLKHPMYWPCF